MQVFVFQSEPDDAVFCYAAAEDGGRLPGVFAPWRYDGSRRLSAMLDSAEDGLIGYALAEIRAKRFYICRQAQA